MSTKMKHTLGGEISYLTLPPPLFTFIPQGPTPQEFNMGFDEDIGNFSFTRRTFERKLPDGCLSMPYDT